MPHVKSLKNFQGTAQEGFVTRGQELSIDQERYEALARNGLVELVGGEKKQPEPSNKMASEPPNKALTTDSMQTKRPERRPLLSTGGVTGPTTVPSSSEPDPAPRRRGSKTREDAHES